MHELSKDSEIAVRLCLILDSVSPLFYQQCNADDVENLKWIGHSMTTTMSVSVSQSSWSSLIRCLILTASIEKLTQSVNFTANEK